MRELLWRPIAHLSGIHPDLRPTARMLPNHFPGMSQRKVAQLRRLEQAADPPIPDDVERVELPTGDLHLPARLADPAAAGVLYFHGGGFMHGSARSDAPYAADVARRLGVPVLAARYGLAPEHRWPEIVDDAWAALEALRTRPGVDPARLVVAGASAGGGLAAVLALRARDRGVPLAGQLLVYPMLDDRASQRRSRNHRDLRMTNEATTRTAWNAYLGMPPASPEAPAEAVPARATRLEGLAPAWIGVGTADLYHDECLAYTARLREAGVPVTTGVVPGAFHAFDRMAPDAAVCLEFTGHYLDWARERLGLSAPPTSP